MCDIVSAVVKKVESKSESWREISYFCKLDKLWSIESY